MLSPFDRARPARALHLVIGVLVLVVLAVGVGAASRLAPQTTHVAVVEPVAAATVVVPVPVAPVRPVRVAAKPRPAHIVKHPVARVVVHRAARVARVARAVTPARAKAKAPAFGAEEAQRRGAAAYASLGHRLPSDWVMVFEVYHGTYQGLADSGRKIVTIWVRASDTQNKLRITIAHEMGHVLDYTTLTDHDKGRYLSLRGRSNTTAPWYPANGTSDYAAPAGDFAEVYALYLAGAGDFRSTFAPQPTSSQLASLGQFFSDLQARHS